MKNAKVLIVVLSIATGVLATGLLFVGLNSVGGFPGVVQGISPVAPTLAAIAGSFSALVAAGSLALTASNNSQNWNRQMRLATLQAWTEWSKSTRISRLKIAKLLGTTPLTAEQAKAISKREPFVSDKGPVTAEESDAIYRAALEVLNGLERLAVGVEQQFYDAQTVRDLGATIIVRQHQMFEQYIVHKRENAGLDHKQMRAYISLSDLVNDFKRHDLDQERLWNLSRRRPRIN